MRRASICFANEVRRGLSLAKGKRVMFAKSFDLLRKQSETPIRGRTRIVEGLEEGDALDEGEALNFVEGLEESIEKRASTSTNY